MKNTLKAYESLKNEFWNSQYLPLSAFAMVKMVDKYNFDKISRKAKIIYQRMNDKHPSLTSAEDSGFAVTAAIAASMVASSSSD